MKLISKSKFLDYLTCPKDAWFRIHKPDLPEFEINNGLQNIFDEGYEVEEYAKNLFPNFVEPKGTWNEVISETSKLVAEQTQCIYQPTFAVNGFNMRSDFMRWDDKNKRWDLYEVKSGTSVKEPPEIRDHISDLAFQTSVLLQSGLTVGKKYLVHINNQYVRDGAIDCNKLFTIADCTDKVNVRLESIEDEMVTAKEYLSNKNEPTNGCDCHFKGRSSQCESFEISHPEIPDYSVHDISSIGRKSKVLREWIKSGVYEFNQIPDPTILSDKQQNQIRVHSTQKEEIDIEKLKNFCEPLTYPIYFVDYESVHPAIPMFDGYNPYVQMVYLASIHFIKEKGGNLEHTEYMHPDASDPGPPVARFLSDNIDPKGTVLVWNETFEKSRNRELGERYPEYKNVMERINNQVVDLAIPFKNHDYIHPDFEGSWSVKAVLPVLAKHLSYDEIAMYQSDNIDTDSWLEMINAKTSSNRKQELDSALREYCALDTFAMVEIFRVLNKI